MCSIWRCGTCALFGDVDRGHYTQGASDLDVRMSLMWVGTSSHPSLAPGPKILEKEPLDTMLPW